MKTFKSFVTTKHDLSEAISTDKKEKFKKILFCTLTQGRLTPNSSNYDYFYREVEDNIGELKFLNINEKSVPNIDIFVEFFSGSPIFKSVNTKVGKTPIIKSLAELEGYFANGNKEEKNQFIKDYSTLAANLESAWNGYKEEVKEMAKAYPDESFIIQKNGFVESVLQLLEASDPESPIVTLFLPTKLI